MRPYMRGPFEFKRDKSLEVFRIAQDVKTVTLWCDGSQLSARIERREFGPDRKPKRSQGHKRRLKIAEDYKDPEKVRMFYDKWFDHLRALPGEHFVVDLKTGDELVPLSNWRYP